jgi:GNAT superfamily N-acetyltransferase
MALEVVPFAGAHLDAAATLLAARHRRDRRRAPALPARFEEPAAVRSVLETTLAGEGVVGAVALRGRRLVGYLLGAPASIDPPHPFAAFRRPRAAEIPVAGHGIVLSDTREVYYALYTALAAQWLTAGIDAHYVQIPVDDRVALACWFALGFGHDATLAVRDTSPIAASAVMPVRQATLADADVLADQAVAILDEMTLPPTCLPPPPNGAREALRAWIAELLEEPTLAQWVALRGREVVGMQLFDGSDRHVAELVTPEQAIYLLGAYTTPAARGQGVGGALLARSLAWARDAGHTWCVLDYLPANPAGTRFWERNHFQPLVYRLCRQLDARVRHAREASRSR